MSDPYPQYQLRTEKGAASGYAPLNGSAKLANIYLPSIDHGVLTGLGDDDHPQYQLRTEKGAINGYAPLDTIGVVPLVHLPADLVVASELAAHEAAADPHPGYQKESEKGAASGYASLDSGGKVPGSQLPADFFGWTSVSSGNVNDTPDIIYTVPAGKTAKISFLSAANTIDDLVTQTVVVYLTRAGYGAIEVATVDLEGLEYAWFVDPSEEYWTLSEGDSISMATTNIDYVVFFMTGAEQSV